MNKIESEIAQYFKEYKPCSCKCHIMKVNECDCECEYKFYDTSLQMTPSQMQERIMIQDSDIQHLCEGLEKCFQYIESQIKNLHNKIIDDLLYYEREIIKLKESISHDRQSKS